MTQRGSLKDFVPAVSFANAIDVDWEHDRVKAEIFEFVCGFHDRFVVLCENLTGIILSSDVEFMKRLVLLNESLETLCKFLLIRVPVEEVVFNVLHDACSFDQHDILVCEYI